MQLPNDARETANGIAAVLFSATTVFITERGEAKKEIAITLPQTPSVVAISNIPLADKAAEAPRKVADPM